MEPNAIGITLLVALLLLWNLDFVATLLNIRALEPETPDEFKDVFDDGRFAKSQDYTRTNARFGIIESIVSLFTLLCFWFIGGFGWLDALTRAWAGDGIFAGLLFLGLIFIGHYLIHLPLSIYSTFVIEEKFGFNRTTPGVFVADQFKSLLLMLILVAPLIAGILWIFDSVPHAWLWAWLLFSGFQLFVTYIAPTAILPLFNKFTPMPEGELRTAIERMAVKCEFPLAEISEIDGSKRSTKANAYFTGFGKTKRIALYDTLVKEQTQGELVAVLAHEIGHFKCRHIIQRMAVSIVQSGILFFLLGLAVDPDGAFARELFDAFGVGTISTAVGLVLFGILFSPVSRLLGVLSNAWSRRHEFEADAFASKVTGHPEDLVTALKKLSANNLSNLTPHRLRVLLDYSHPPLLERLRALQSQ
ncbi:peptidase M48 [Haloferula helveola]|uniref:Peptidase M48 n=1 Tax=Haloferula helveola TaxID=490095 RepID=A0ABN6HA94_9BACT|nr:peptidase M48 [Haloferula helveola]